MDIFDDNSDTGWESGFQIGGWCPQIAFVQQSSNPAVPSSRLSHQSKFPQNQNPDHGRFLTALPMRAWGALLFHINRESDLLTCVCLLTGMRASNNKYNYKVTTGREPFQERRQRGCRNRCCGNLRLLMKIRPFEPDFSCFSNDFRKITELSARYLKTLTE